MWKDLCEIAIQKASSEGRLEAVIRRDHCAIFSWHPSRGEQTKHSDHFQGTMGNANHAPEQYRPLPGPCLAAPTSEELLPLPLLCSTSCFILKHNSASLPHCNALHNPRTKLFAVHKHTGSTGLCHTRCLRKHKTSLAQTGLISLWPSGKHECQELLILLNSSCSECFSLKYSCL